MEYTFSIGWFIGGLLVLALGGVVSLYYNKFAEISGFASYSKWRLAGLIICGIGLVFMLNLHTFFLMMLIQLVFSGR